MIHPREPLLFLIGYRGTGKSTVARLVADRLGWDWVDADCALEKRHERTIRQIFADEGEAGFREKEAGVLRELAALRRCVAATGGGVVLRPDNRERLRTGWAIWLTAAPAVLWQRLQADAATTERRPNLTIGGLREIEELLAVRTPLYQACADFTLDTTDMSCSAVADAIADWYACQR